MTLPIYRLDRTEIDRFTRHGLVTVRPREEGKLTGRLYGEYSIDFTGLAEQPLFVWREKRHPEGSNYTIASCRICSFRGNHLPQDKMIWRADPNRKILRVNIIPMDGTERVEFIYNGQNI